MVPKWAVLVQAGGIIFEQQRPKSVTNDKYFRNWGAQAAMCLVIRAQNTERLLSGGKIDPGRCLFINPEIPELTRYACGYGPSRMDGRNGQVPDRASNRVLQGAATAVAGFLRRRTVGLQPRCTARAAGELFKYFERINDAMNHSVTVAPG